ncbi:MAG: type II secretion system protein [Candidatus Yonathbacteria bacterium]|nr:type II secretion system protein [Candidatus Yonathbacteria bacterium]
MRNQYSIFNIQYSAKRGSLLLELLIAISVLAIVLSVGTQAVYVSLQSGKTSAESDVAIGLANEALEAVRSTAEEKWQNIYTLTKTTQHYYPAQSAGKWVLTAGDETIALNTANYTRYVTIENVNRCNDTSRLIASSTPGCTPSTNYSDDPSTQKVAVAVSWQGNGSPVTVSDYFFRFRNIVCLQTSWTSSGSSGVKPCTDTTYDTATNLGTPPLTTLQVQ